jgi:tRNA(Arg) A34 adenosine deaminase TadA
MRLAIEASRQGSAAGDGGPFGAAVFDADGTRLVALGANLVLATGCTALHAEIVALMRMQELLRCGRLLPADAPRFALVTSAEPCAMCLGAIVWSGVGQVVCGARDADVRAIGFDEGDKPPDWPQAFRRRGIVVRPDVLRADARAVLAEFQRASGIIY